MSSTDPFTRVYNALWDVLEKHKGLTDLVKVGNRIKFTERGFGLRPEKDNIMDGDLPELLLVPANSQTQLFATSSSTQAIQEFELRFTTGDQRIDQLHFPLKWQVMIALSKCQKLNLPFVKRLGIDSFTETTDDPEANRGKKGWSARILISVEMWFGHTVLQGTDTRILEEI